MPQRRGKTQKHRALKTKKLGAKAKNARENHGTTPAFPLTGAIPSLRAGKPVKASSILAPAKK